MSKTIPRSDLTPAAINGVELCVQTFGGAADAAIVLIGGAAAAMDYWEDDFCEELAAGKRFVIRYDARDTGGSTHYKPGAPSYTVRDLMLDVLGVAGHFQLARVHLAGISMGATLALLAALEQPKRMASLTLLSTSPGGPGGPDSPNPDLPPISEKLAAFFAADSDELTDWTDRASSLDRLIADERLFAGTHPYDEAARRALLGRIFDRTQNMASSAINHWKLESGTTRLRPQLKALDIPTLIFHGSEDPLFPIGHGRALAQELPRARLIELPGVGHEYPPRPLWPRIIPAILEHTS